MMRHRAFLLALAFCALSAGAQAACVPPAAADIGSPFATRGVTRLDTQTSDAVKFTGGCIDGTPIGQNEPAAGAFTDLTIDGVEAMNVVASNATLPAARNNLGFTEVNVMDYGAIADGNPRALSTVYATLAAAQAVCPSATALTQQIDWCAIDAGIAAVKATGPTSGIAYSKYLRIPPGKYYLGADDTVNLTCLSDVAGTYGCGAAANNGRFQIMAEGAIFVCHTTGKPCIYGIGSRFVEITGLSISASCTNTPTAGLMIGRAKNAISADTWRTTRMSIGGCYSKASLYQHNSEIFIDVGSTFQNQSPAADSYAVILDVGNHWGVPSLYGVTVTITTDQLQPFGQPTFIGTQIVSVGTGSAAGPLWVYGSKQALFLNSYLAGPTDHCIVFYIDTSGNEASVPLFFTGDIHCEGPGGTMNDIIFVTGGTSGSHISPTIKGLHLKELNNHAVVSLFAHDSFVDKVTLKNGSIDIAGSLFNITVATDPLVWFFLNQQFTVPSNILTASAGVVTTAPSILFRSAIPFVATPTGSMGNNGALTIGTALGLTYANAYFYLPANAISAGSAAGWYYGTCTTTTACTVFNNTYTIGQPTIPASPTAFVTTGPGAYSGPGAAQAIIAQQITVPGGALGKRGGVRVTQKSSTINNANTKTVRVKFASIVAYSQAITTALGNTVIVSCENRDREDRQLCANTQSVGVSGSAFAVGTSNTATDVTLQIEVQLNTADTDYIVSEGVTVELLSSPPY
jgi:hypothetical protein